MLLGVLVDSISNEGDFKESISTFLVPESVGRGDSALSLSRVEVDSINDSLISLREAGELRGELVDRLGSPGSDMKRYRCIKEG